MKIRFDIFFATLVQQIFFKKNLTNDGGSRLIATHYTETVTKQDTNTKGKLFHIRKE